MTEVIVEIPFQVYFYILSNEGSNLFTYLSGLSHKSYAFVLRLKDRKDFATVKHSQHSAHSLVLLAAYRVAPADGFLKSQEVSP